MIRPFLTCTVLAVAAVGFTGCGGGNESTTTTNPPKTTGTPTGGAGERTGRAVDNAARDTADAARNAGDAAATRTGSGAPGLPSVTGTSTSGMSTADAAAQRLIDNARKNLTENDVSKAKTLVSELRQDGMFNSLSADMKAKVEQLEKDVNAAQPK